MASERQIAANKENAKRSTGPRSAAGKMRSRWNALKLGLSANTLTPLLGESPGEYEELLKEFDADFMPRTTFGRQKVKELAGLALKMRRLERIETALANWATKQRLCGLERALRDDRGLTKNPAESNARLADLQDALYDMDLVATGFQIAAADQMFEGVTIAKIDRRRTELQRQEQRALDQLDRAEKRFASKLEAAGAMPVRIDKRPARSKDVRDTEARAELLALAAADTLARLICDPEVPQQTRTKLTEVLLVRGENDADQVAEEKHRTLSDEFEAIVRRLNNRNDPAVKALIDRNRAELIDFSVLDRFEQK